MLLISRLSARDHSPNLFPAAPAVPLTAHPAVAAALPTPPTTGLSQPHSPLKETQPPLAAAEAG